VRAFSLQWCIIDYASIRTSQIINYGADNRFFKEHNRLSVKIYRHNRLSGVFKKGHNRLLCAIIDYAVFLSTNIIDYPRIIDYPLCITESIIDYVLYFFEILCFLIFFM